MLFEKVKVQRLKINHCFVLADQEKGVFKVECKFSGMGVVVCVCVRMRARPGVGQFPEGLGQHNKDQINKLTSNYHLLCLYSLNTLKKA